MRRNCMLDLCALVGGPGFAFQYEIARRVRFDMMRVVQDHLEPDRCSISCEAQDLFHDRVRHHADRLGVSSLELLSVAVALFHGESVLDICEEDQEGHERWHLSAAFDAPFLACLLSEDGQPEM